MDTGFEILIPIAFFAMIAAIVLGPRYFRSRDRQRLLDTLRIAYDRGQPVPPEIIESLHFDERAKPISSPDRDLRSGIVLVAVGLAFVVLAGTIQYVEGDEEAWILAAIGAFPGLIGLAHIAFWLGRRGRTTDRLDA